MQFPSCAITPVLSRTKPLITIQRIMQYYSTQKSRVLSNAKRIKNKRNYLKAKRQNESMKTLNLKLSAKNHLPAINFWYARIIRVPNHKKYEKTPNKYSYPHVSSPKSNENEKHSENNFLMNLNAASPSHKTFISKTEKRIPVSFQHGEVWKPSTVKFILEEPGIYVHHTRTNQRTHHWIQLELGKIAPELTTKLFLL